MPLGDTRTPDDGWHSTGVRATPIGDGEEDMSMTSSNTVSPSSSSSSSSSVLFEEQDDCGYMAHDVYQRQPLLPGHDTYIQSLDGRLYKQNSGGYYKESGSKKMVKLALPNTVRHEMRFPRELQKTVLAFGFLICSVIFTAFFHVLTHERVPSVPRLPDIIIDNTSIKYWGFISPDIPLMLSVYSALGVVFFHKHRLIVIRRIFFIMGLIYFYRAIAFFVTVLPVPRPESHCLPKLNTTAVVPVFKRMFLIFSNFGMTNVIFCGDYIYSGHTACFVISYLVIKEYSPKRWWVVHWLYGAMAAVGVMMLIIFGNHYTIDCVIAYVIATRTFYIYHTLAQNQCLKEHGPNNFFERVWWFSLFQYFERNIHGVVPRHYEWPLPWPRAWRSQNLL